MKKSEERLKALQNLHANLKTISKARPIQAGDYVIIDYEASMDGKPLEGGKAIDFTVEVGSGQFIPAFEEKLIGLKPEEEREIEVSFPEDYGYQKWAGKTISFHVKIKEIKEKILPSLDDEFAKDLGDYSSFEELKTKLRGEIEKEKELALERQLKDQMVDQLLAGEPLRGSREFGGGTDQSPDLGYKVETELPKGWNLKIWASQRRNFKGIIRPWLKNRSGPSSSLRRLQVKKGFQSPMKRWRTV